MAWHCTAAPGHAHRTALAWNHLDRREDQPLRSGLYRTLHPIVPGKFPHSAFRYPKANGRLLHFNVGDVILRHVGCQLQIDVRRALARWRRSAW